jgi:hypothetical protein
VIIEWSRPHNRLPVLCRGGARLIRGVGLLLVPKLRLGNQLRLGNTQDLTSDGETPNICVHSGSTVGWDERSDSQQMARRMLGFVPQPSEP